MMKLNKLQFLSLVAATAFFITSCAPGRPYASSPGPYSRGFVSLIITPTPGFTMNHYPDGRYYHRSPQGFIYWKGYDNRFFLDKKYVNRSHYSNREYNEWKRWYDQRRRPGNRRHPY